jgi:hypothetical protein
MVELADKSSQDLATVRASTPTSARACWLERRYEQLKNIKLLSCLHFLTNPLEYDSDDGLLEVPELRSEVKGLCTRLFPEPELEPTVSQEDQN